MKDQTIVITGANRGIGLELCRQLHRDNEVVATARQPQAASELAALGVRVERLDVADTASAQALGERLGELAVDVLINNAGRGPAEEGIEKLDFESSLLDFEVNALGPMRVTQALLPHLRRSHARKIIHITSNLGSLTNNVEGGYYAYRSSKAALNMFNRSLGRELEGEGFTCVALHPGWVRTDMGGAHAPLLVEESVAALVGIIGGLARGENGSFMDYAGATLPW